jgi:aryl-phospho-beta-D-glucosidase BglC (GH1 family)
MNNYKNFKDTQQTDKWLKQNGVNVAHIYVGTAELFQATKLATITLKDFGRLLVQNQAHTLNDFLKAARSGKTRTKITKGQCYTVMNIAKQAQRKSAKFLKARK